jgi:catechol 2,3-dioxygenase-like lactoylglutathione lyase family enzyme
MELVDFYPVVVTDRLRECRDFYRRWFALEVGFEADWFVLLKDGGSKLTLAFMHSEHPTSPPSPAKYRGDGAFVTFQVADAEVEYRRLVDGGLHCDLPLTDEPWGQRRFGVFDPAGMWVDVVEQIEPVTGWWDPYLTMEGA